MVALTGQVVGCSLQYEEARGEKKVSSFVSSRPDQRQALLASTTAMSKTISAVNSGWKCSRCLYKSQVYSQILPARSLSSAVRREELQTQTSTTPHASSPLTPWKTPDTVVGAQQEKLLLKKTGKMPVGSRRRRLIVRAFAQSGETGIPFTQLPYQCFQEARKFLAEDREEKIEAIELFRKRIINLMAQDPASSGGEQNKKRRLDGMKKTLEHYKILADINDPLVKKNFEDGKGMILRVVYVMAFTN